MPPVEPLHGPISMFSQSGNVSTQILLWGRDEGVGFEKFVNSGNEGDLTSEDYLRYFARDKASRIILAYIEGVDPGSALLPIAKEITRKKPVIVFKGGRTNAGRGAASSHSGAMAGSLRIYRSVFRQAGMIEVYSTQEMIDYAKALAAYPIPHGNGVGILTRGGGWGVITADCCEENGLAVPSLPENLSKRLDQILPRYWSRGNPVDMVAGIYPEPFMTCLEILANWEDIDVVIALGGGAGRGMLNSSRRKKVLELLRATEESLFKMEEAMVERQKEVLSFARQLMEECGKPIISVTLGSTDSRRDNMEFCQLLSYPTPERAVKALAAMWNYKRIRDGL